jgi:hypothetical protein
VAQQRVTGPPTHRSPRATDQGGTPRSVPSHDSGCPRPREPRRKAQPIATDYDAPRRSEADELGEDSLEELKARRAEAQSSSVDVDETDFNENLELPGADLSNEELTVRVLPKQEDEFTCSRCFLVQHRSRLAATRGDQMYCRDCAA